MINNNNNVSMNRAKVLKNDEYYTKKEDVIRIMKSYAWKIKIQTNLWLPFDTRDSWFTKLLIANAKGTHIKNIFFSHPSIGLWVYRVEAGRYDQLDSEGDFFILHKRIYGMQFQLGTIFIISNPPFSKIDDVMECLFKFEYVIIGPWTLIKKNWVFDMYKDEVLIIPDYSLKFQEFICNGEIKRVNANIYTSCEVNERNFIKEPKQLDKPNGWAVNKYGEHFKNFDSVHFIDEEIDFLEVVAVPVSYLSCQREGYEVIDMINTPKDENGNNKFFRWLIKKVAYFDDKEMLPDGEI